VKKNIIRIAILIAVALVGLSPAAHGERPTWAKKATAFEVMCRERSEFHKCKSLRIPSPDNKSSVEIDYQKVDDMMVADLQLTSPGRGVRDLGSACSNFLDNGADELLWSPNSKAFFIDGGCGSAIAGFVVRVYLVDSANIDVGLDLDVGLDITQQAMHDMVRSFPPCKALNHDPKVCEAMQTNREYYNMSGVDWLEDSSGIVVMSEVIPSSLYGGIMGQVMGYELEVPSGKILGRLNAKQFKMKWQKSMAWKFRIPDPPEYQ
jgi:hypothetical protein